MLGSLLPAGLGDRVAHPLAQPSRAIGSAVGLSLLLITASGRVRAGLAVAYRGPWKPNLLKVPSELEPFFATL
ncbi:MAG: hypothetical protein CFE45_16795 [Burkholderiales bacterium PBB5]|nr:MAG: hypothetical protein CFE45_16795 [Burkholderiales bacterium PBB5]